MKMMVAIESPEAAGEEVQNHWDRIPNRLNACQSQSERFFRKSILRCAFSLLIQPQLGLQKHVTLDLSSDKTETLEERIFWRGRRSGSLRRHRRRCLWKTYLVRLSIMMRLDTDSVIAAGKEAPDDSDTDDDRLTLASHPDEDEKFLLLDAKLKKSRVVADMPFYDEDGEMIPALDLQHRLTRGTPVLVKLRLRM